MATASSSGMTEKRAGEIALKAIKLKMKRDGIDDSLYRNLGNAAKELGISREEAREFTHYILPDVLREILGADSVSLNVSFRD